MQSIILNSKKQKAYLKSLKEKGYDEKLYKKWLKSIIEDCKRENKEWGI